MKYCIYCGAAAGDEAKFCPKCGKKIDYDTSGAVQGSGSSLSDVTFDSTQARKSGSGNTGRNRQERRITTGFVILLLILAAFFIVYRNKIRLPSLDFGNAQAETAEAVLNDDNSTKTEGNPGNTIRIPAE